MPSAEAEQKNCPPSTMRLSSIKTLEKGPAKNYLVGSLFVNFLTFYQFCDLHILIGKVTG